MPLWFILLKNSPILWSTVGYQFTRIRFFFPLDYNQRVRCESFSTTSLASGHCIQRKGCWPLSASCATQSFIHPSITNAIGTGCRESTERVESVWSVWSVQSACWRMQRLCAGSEASIRDRRTQTTAATFPKLIWAFTDWPLAGWLSGQLVSSWVSSNLLQYCSTVTESQFKPISSQQGRVRSLLFHLVLNIVNALSLLSFRL